MIAFKFSGRNFASRGGWSSVWYVATVLHSILLVRDRTIMPRLTHLLARLLDGLRLVQAQLSNEGALVLLGRLLGVQAQRY